MFLKPRLRRRFAWLALCAMLFGSLAPSLAEALPAFAGKSWVEICSAAGMARIHVDEAPDPAGDTHAAKKYCPFLLALQHLPPIADAAALPDPPAAHSHDAVFFPSTGAPPAALVFRVANPSHAPPPFLLT